MGLSSLLRKARNIGPSIDNPFSGDKISPIDLITMGATKGARDVTPQAQDVFRDTPIVGNLIDAESSADIAAGQQSNALNQAQEYQERMFKQAQGMLSPYADVGQNAMLGTMGEDGVRSGGLVNDINSGKYLQDDFSYGGTQPEFSYGGKQVGAFDYKGPQMSSSVGYGGQQPDAFNYQGAGQQGQLDYSGAPVDRSIESYMKNDPSMAWQQEQMEKMINRQGAAKGRWGGGGTFREMNRETARLLSQDYANRFNRASMERGADVGAERDKYGRALTGLYLQNQAEQSGYNRSTGEYGMNVAREQDAYGRALTDTNLGNQSAQNLYDQAQYGYQTGVDRERDAYGRTVDQYGMNRDREQNMYNRATSEYGMKNERLQNALAQQTAIANLGPQMAQSMANAALGQGSNLSNLAIQGGNANAAATMAQGNQFGKLLEMAGGAAKLYGAT